MNFYLYEMNSVGVTW